MKINLEINNTTQSPVEDDFFISVAEKTFAELRLNFLEEKEVTVSLALVKPEEIQKLNRVHRKNNSVTDILSFAEYREIEEIKKDVDKEIFLGELILCYDDIKEYAADEGIKLEKELANVVSHGILHLLGFEHGEKMFELQNRIKNKI
ncbi:MAG: rRNA maturation RNase YbeY [Parcubacteria group bacterium]|jgi:probable rRNA maturation factor